MNGEQTHRAVRGPQPHGSHLAALACVAFVVPVLSAISSDPSYLVFLGAEPHDVILLTMLLTVVFPGAIVLAQSLLVRFLPRFAKPVGYTVLFVCASTLWLTACTRLGVFGECCLPFLALLLGWTSMRLYQDVEVVRRLLGSLALMCLTLPAWFLHAERDMLVLGHSSDSAASNPVAGGRAVSAPPIVFIVFDELPLFTLLNPDLTVNRAAFPGFASLADTATWFRDTTTVSPVTNYAVPAILTGKYPSTSRYKLPWFLDYPQNLFTLLGGAYRLHVFEQVTRLCPSELCGAASARPSGWRNFARIVGALIELDAHLLVPPSMAIGLRRIALDAGEYHVTPVGFIYQRAWDDAHFLFRRFTQSLEPSAQPVLYFLHITMPHQPYRYLPSGHEYFDVRAERMVPILPKEEFRAELWQQRYLLQLQDVDRQLGQIFDTLKSKKIFDQSVIVVTADHGTSFQAGEAARTLSERDGGELLRVPLFIKVPFQTHGDVHDTAAETIDVLPSLLSLIGRPRPGAIDGIDLFHAPATPARDRHYFALDKTTCREQSVRQPVDIQPFVARQAALFGKDLRDVARTGPTDPMIGRKASDVPSLHDPSIAVTLEIPAHFVLKHASDQPVPAFITGSVHGANLAGGHRDIAIVVNGTVAAVTTAFAVDEPGTRRFEAMVPESVFVHGVNSIAALPIDAAALRR